MIRVYVLTAAIIIMAGLAAVQTTRLEVATKSRTQAEDALAADRQAAIKASADGQLKARETEQTLGQSAGETRKQTNDQISLTRVQHDALLERVRVAEARARSRVPSGGPTPVASNGQAAPGSHRPELLGSLGAEDVSEAKRAEDIRLTLLGCYRQYDAAAEALRAFTGTGGAK